MVSRKMWLSTVLVGWLVQSSPTKTTTNKRHTRRTERLSMPRCLDASMRPSLHPFNATLRRVGAVDKVVGRAGHVALLQTVKFGGDDGGAVRGWDGGSLERWGDATLEAMAIWYSNGTLRGATLWVWRGVSNPPMLHDCVYRWMSNISVRLCVGIFGLFLF